jgi:uncharacterized protein
MSLRDADPRPADRIAALDVLRGIALLGMFLVHFHYYVTNPGSWPPVSAAYDWIVVHLMEERFWTMFGILFGAGFALQLRRAEMRGAPFTAMYLRRAAVLIVFGLIAHGIFGYYILASYAVGGLVLLLMRRWSTRALLIALILSATSGSIYSIGSASFRALTVGEHAGRAEAQAIVQRNQAFLNANRAAQEAPRFADVLQARLQHVQWFYRQPLSLFPVNSFTLLLLGVLALRLGYFDDPVRHRRAITVLMAFGVLSWALQFIIPRFAALRGAPPVWPLIVEHAKNAFGLIRGAWLSFAYIGVVLLLANRDTIWLKRLAVFGWTGRMALTNYMLQVAVLDLLFAKYAFGLALTTLESVAAGLALFGLNAVASRWWLTRFRFGPLEWLWRSATYASWQPLHRESRHEAVAHSLAQQ